MTWSSNAPETCQSTSQVAQTPRESASQHKAVIKPFVDGHSPMQCLQQLPDTGVVSGEGHCAVLHAEVLDHQPRCPTRGLPMKSFPPIVKGHQPIRETACTKQAGHRPEGGWDRRAHGASCEQLRRPPWLTPCLLASPGPPQHGPS